MFVSLSHEINEKWQLAFVVLSVGSSLVKSICMTSSRTFLPQNETCDTHNKTKDWALVQNAALVGVEVSLG